MDAIQILDKYKARVWPVIESYLKDPTYPKQFIIPSKFKSSLDKFWEINKVYPERKGKYLRPSAVLLLAGALGVRSKIALKTAAAMQLSEEWILIHDDIEDKSDLRRNAPSLHKLYGLELALNAGDALHMIMWKIIMDIGNPKITEEFYRMLFRTAVGQGIEQMWANEGKRLKEDEYFFIADTKSAYYSVAGPMRLGALAAGASDSKVDKITNFGLHVGRCFQLVDDILDEKQDKIEGKSSLVQEKGTKYARRVAEGERKKALEVFDKDLGFLSSEPERTNIKILIDFILNRVY